MIDSLRYRHRYLIAILILLAACTHADPLPAPTVTPQVVQRFKTTPTATNIPETLPATDPTPTSLFTPMPEPPDISRRTHTHLDVTFDYAQKTLQVTQKISYTNTTDELLSPIPLVIPPATQAGLFRLESLEPGPGTNLTNLAMENSQIWLHFQPPVMPEQTIEITLDFQLNIPPGGKAFGYTHRQTLLADWHPFIPPYLEDHGWLINAPGPVGEYLVYPLSDFTVNLCLSPPDLDLIIAASAPLTQQAEGCFVYHTLAKRNFTLAISPYYHVSTASNETVTVKVYNFPAHAAMGDRTAKLALSAWDTFTELFGDNQRQFMSIVEADIFDGLEADGLFYLSDWYFSSADQTPKNYYELLIVHETAHQWFFGYVHNDQANEPWLDEALATYCELLFYEKHHPGLVDWWWQFRVHSFSPTGAVNSTIYDYNEYRPYINAVYLRGALFLQALRDQTGDDAFSTFLYKFVQSGEDDFMRDTTYFNELLDTVSDADIAPILSEFFH